MTIQIPGGEMLRQVLNTMFGIGAIVMFGEIILVLYRTATTRFTIGRIVEFCIFVLLFTFCLDWVSGFNFFENIFAPIVWNFLNSASTS
jgi:hypothetical protein